MWIWQHAVLYLSVCIYVLSILPSIQPAPSQPRIWQYGCYARGAFNSPITNHSNNSPGTCLETCTTSKFIALQDEYCSCPDEIRNGDINVRRVDCSSPCHGNPYHFCGNSQSDLFSIYNVERGVIDSVDKCVMRNCGNGSLLTESCEQEYPAFVGQRPVNTDKMSEMTEGKISWTSMDAWKDVYANEFDIACWTNKEECTQNKISCGQNSNNMWVRSFGKYAPIVCKLFPADNITVTTVSANGHAQVGDWSNYTCLPGYRLESGNLTRQCQSDGTWDGTDPDCIQNRTTTTTSTTTRTINSTTFSTSAETTTSNPTIKIPTDKPKSGTTPLAPSFMPSVDEHRSDKSSDVPWKLPLATSFAVVEGAVIIVCIVIILKEKALSHRRASVSPEENGSSTPQMAANSTPATHQGPARDRFDRGNAQSLPTQMAANSTPATHQSPGRDRFDRVNPQSLPAPAVNQPNGVNGSVRQNLNILPPLPQLQATVQGDIPRAGEDEGGNQNVGEDETNRRHKHRDETPEERIERKKLRREKKERKRREREELERKEQELERMEQEKLESREQDELESREQDELERTGQDQLKSGERGGEI